MSPPISARRARWSPFEIAFWIVAFATIWLFPGKHLILTETAILALFALSLDLILGYAGIISLGHAAFFGVAGYFAGLIAKYGIITEPVIALVLAGLAAAALGFVTSFLVLRGSDLTRLMVTLGVSLISANSPTASPISPAAPTACRASPSTDPRPVPVRSVRPHRLRLLAHRAVRLLPDRAAHRLFAVRTVAALMKGNPLRASAIGIPVNRRLVAIYTVSAGFAGIAGALLTQTTAFCSLDVLSLDRSADLLLVLIIGGTGYLYGGLIGAVIYRLLQD